jgi:uncharacterized protein (DUF1800 family)
MEPSMRRFGSMLVVVAVGALAGTAAVRSVSGMVISVTETVRELTQREQASHALNRLAFGPRPGDVEHVLRMGVDRWIELQLHPGRIDDRKTERVLAALPHVSWSADRLLREYPPPGAVLAAARRRGDTALTGRDSAQLRRQAQRGRRFVTDLLAAKVARAVVSDRQLQEVLTDFWENHFNVFIGKAQVRYYLADYTRDAIRPHALGRFRDLLGAVATSPAMLLYLDNAQSVAEAPPTAPRRRPPAAQRRTRGLNENYARELLELHTVGVDGGYTQEDVINVARALTGWSLNPPRLGRTGFVFRRAAHDAGEKVVLGHRLRAGRGIEDGEQVLDILSRHPSTARFIARKLAVRFVSDSPPDELVDRAAATFTRTSGDIREVVRTIITSPEFFSRQAYRSKVKSPFEVTVSALRALAAQADTTPLTAGLIARLGQPIYGHQAPNGWPETGSAWMNTGAILNRINLGLFLAADRVPGAPLRGWPAYDSLARAPREMQVDAVIESFLGGRVSPDTREILLSGNNPLAGQAARDSALFMTDADEPTAGGRGGRRPGQMARGRGAAFGRIPNLTGLPQIIGLALGSPEFQRR